MHTRSATALGALLGAAAVAFAAAPAASGEVECAGSSACKTLEGPWVVVPPEPNVGAQNQITATWLMTCMPNDAVGSDWVSGDQENDDDVIPLTIWMTAPLPGLRLQDGQGAEWGGENDTLHPHSFKPLLGCETDPLRAARTARPSAISAGARGHVRRVTLKKLRANRTRTFSFGCRRGQSLVGSAHGVGFFQERPPSARQMNQVTSTRVHRKGKVRVTVKTGRRMGDDKDVRIQIHALCRSR
jgi:hypothetical protein